MSMAELTAGILERGNEARIELASLASGACGAIPADWLADQVLRVHAQAGWPVLRGAVEALSRRWEFAERDGLLVASGPPDGVLGEYVTKARRSAPRPYRTVLAGVTPLRASCSCPDFRRASLGACKHVLVVLDALARKTRAWQRALREQPTRPWRINWNPIRPLLGDDDWLERVRLEDSGGRKGRAPRFARHFTRGVGAERVLKGTFPDRPERRLVLVKELLTASRGGDPALEHRLVEEVQELERVSALRAAARELEKPLARLKRELYPYQREGVTRFLARGRLLLADDMGLGKTVQAIAACHALHQAELVQRGLLIVPAALKNQWLREWRATSDVSIAVVEGGQDARERTYARTRNGFLIANYEQLLRDLEIIRSWNPEIAVLDEAQRIKNWQAKTSHAVKSLRPHYRLVLTGTPMENRLEELASIVEWVDDHALEPKWRLVPVHARLADGKREIIGAAHLDSLRARLAPCMLRRVRREVLSQLPARTDTTIPIDLTDAQLSEHAELERPIAALLKTAHARPLRSEEFLRLMQLLDRQRRICNGLALSDFEELWPSLRTRTPTDRVLNSLDSPKLNEFRALVAGLMEQGRKVVVFSQWRRMLELSAWAISDLLREAGARAAFFTGHESSRRRTQNVVDFHDDPEVRALFLTDAGGVGLNLQRAASACILLELPWNPAVLEQRVGRIHRLGQTEPVEVYSLVSQGGIEERITSLLSGKRALFVNLFDGTSDEVHFDRSGTFLESLRRVLPVEELASIEEEEEEAVVIEPEPPEEAPELGLGTGLERPASAGRPVLSATLPGMKLERGADGSLSLHAPPESAQTLIRVLEELTRMLRASQMLDGSDPTGSSAGVR